MKSIDNYIANYINGFPYLNVEKAATVGEGIMKVAPQEQQHFLDVAENYQGEVMKFVPASGAASRMFKDLFEAKELLQRGEPLPADAPAVRFLSHIKEFPFYDESSLEEKSDLEVLDWVLTDSGLNYGALPKGQLLFHSYSDGARSPFEEHLVEGALYAMSYPKPDAKSQTNVVKIHFTVSPEHMEGFVSLLDRVREKYQKRFNCEYHISFSVQRPETDIVAVNEDNTPFVKEDGSLLYRPGGHGALLSNLNETDGDIVILKNIDNVVKEELIDQTVRWKKILIGVLVEAQKEVFNYLRRLDCEEISCALCDEIVGFFKERFCVTTPYDFDSLELGAKAQYLRDMLNRPIRVCGMVKNEGEPGGGPYIIKEADGSTSLQILEGAQLNTSDGRVAEIVKGATHFNPVDLVCAFKDYEGKKFDLSKFVDSNTGFISSKSYKGRKLKAQELPGLWNGSMSRWNTIFVEVPLITFNPVKTVLDLLRDEHRKIING